MSTATTLAYSMAGAAEASGLSVSQLDRAIRSGHLRVKWSSKDEDGNPTGKRVILATALHEYLEGLMDG